MIELSAIPRMTRVASKADVIGWDVANWSLALDFWRRCLPVDDTTTVLEIGSRQGGLSLDFALRGAGFVTCSDLAGPQPSAANLHRRYGVLDRICGLAADATYLPIADRSVDIVACKSVLGGIGAYGNRDRIAAAIEEVYRVLKPGGHFCFAENLVASHLHRWCRTRFTAWGDRWHYFALPELRHELGAFDGLQLRTCGVIALFGRCEQQRRILGMIDRIVAPIVPRDYHYIGYGICQRPD